MTDDEVYHYQKLMWDSWQSTILSAALKIIMTMIGDKERFKAELIESWEEISRQEISKALQDVRIKIEEGALPPGNLGQLQHELDQLMETVKGMIYRQLNGM